MIIGQEKIRTSTVATIFFFSSATGVSNDTNAKLIWLGSGTICPINQTDVYIAGQKKKHSLLIFSFDSSLFVLGETRLKPKPRCIVFGESVKFVV